MHSLYKRPIPVLCGNRTAEEPRTVRCHKFTQLDFEVMPSARCVFVVNVAQSANLRPARTQCVVVSAFAIKESSSVSFSPASVRSSVDPSPVDHFFAETQ